MKPNVASPCDQSTEKKIPLSEISIEDLHEAVRFDTPEKLNAFEILHVKTGTGNLTIDNREYPLQSNTFFCLAPGQIRSLQSGENTEGKRISLSLQFLILALGHANYYTTEWLAPGSRDLDDLLLRMKHELVAQDDLASDVIRSLFMVFMIDLRRRSESHNNRMETANNDKFIVQRFFISLQKHHVSKKLVADYADELCISPNYLNAVVKRQTGFPASYHIQQFIIVEAKRQAIYSDLRMKEVAERLGFDDYAHFSKFFKNYSGMNFSDFKRNRVA